jgi:hypothetical protein
MATILGSILRGVNRLDNDKLNILSINTCEKFQTLLAKTNHNFYFIKINGHKQWDTKTRDIPENCKEIEIEQLNHLNFDLIICQDRINHYNILASFALKFSCPIIGVDYSIPLPQYNQFQIQAMADRIYNDTIVCSKFVAERWGLDSHDVNIITKSIDTNLFNGWIGGDCKILTNVDFYHNKANITGFETWIKLKKNFNMNPIGNSPGLSVSVKNQNELVDVYKKASVFVNTSSWLSTPYELLEAMSCGCPIVTTKTTDIIDIIKNGENGFITNNYDEMVDYIKSLQKDNNLAQKIGDEGRKTIIEKFNEKDFVHSWNSIFNKNIDNICKLFRNQYDS